MHITAITPENISFFKNYLLPDIAESTTPYLKLGLIDHTTACGSIAGWLSHGVLEIVSLYVAPDYRRKGGGTLLFQGLLECNPVVYTADILPISQDMQLLPLFFTAMKMHQSESEGTQYAATLEKISQQRLFQNHLTIPESVTPFSQVAPLLQRQITTHLALPGGVKDVEQRTSMVWLSGAKVNGYLILVKEDDVDCITLSMLYMEPKLNLYLPQLLQASLASLMEHYPPETLLLVQPAGDASLALMRALLGDLTPINQNWRGTTLPTIDEEGV